MMNIQRLFRSPVLPAVVVFLAVSAFGLVPPFSRDALNDHMMLPWLWQYHGLFWRDAQLMFTAYPPLADMAYILFAGYPWDWAASLWHGCGAVLTLIMLQRTMRHLHVDTTSTGVALLAWMTAPVVVALCTWAYVDLWLCAAAASMAAYITKAQWHRRDACMYGVILGLGALIKYNGVPLAIAGMLALGWRWRHTRSVWIWGLQAAMLSALVAGWWYWENWHTFGHILYPIGEGEGFQWLKYRELAYHEDFFWALLSPLRQFFWGQVNQAQWFDGMLHPLWLLGIAACWRTRHSPRIAALGMMVVVYALFALSTSVRARYWLPGMTLLIPLLGIGLMHIRTRWGKAAVMASFVPGIVVSAMYLMALSPWTYWLHGRDAFLTKHVPDYAITRWADMHLPKSATVYLLWTGGRAYYLHRAYQADFATGNKTFLREIAKEDANDQSYVLMRRDLANQTQGKRMPQVWAGYLAGTCLLAKQGVFELRQMNPCE